MSDTPSIPSHLLPFLPSSAIPIPSPSSSSSTLTNNTDTRHNINVNRNTSKTSIPTFPPVSAAAPPPKKSSTISMSLSTNVSDLLLSSLLPPNLPKLPSSIPSSGGRKGVGAPRELSTQKEGLSLPLVSNNFRRFVTRVGPVFWLQDRIEEILFWRKPIWTWAWMMTWTFICFQPRALLLLPSLILMLILLHTHERLAPLPSLLGISIPPSTATDRFQPPSPNPAGNPNASGGGFTSTSTKDADGETVEKVVVPPKEAESAVDYYMNLQAIQNLMGLISDGYDYIAPKLASLQSTNPPSSTLSLPITPTHLVLLLLPPTFLLPLTPSALIPYLLLPMGLSPPLLFHPNVTPFIYTLPSHPVIRKIRSYIENFLLDDRLSDEIGRSTISKVEVWENERLDPKISSSLSSNTTNANSSSLTSLSNTSNSQSSVLPTIPNGSWSSKNLRASDRSPWIKVNNDQSKWKSIEDLPMPSSSDAKNSENENSKENKEAKLVLALKQGWQWIPGEDWRIDLSGLWSDHGVDEEGWLYTDDSWQNPAPTPYTEADIPSNDKSLTVTAGMMPGLALRRTTRRRRWWRRVYEISHEV
ncbi:uncharacterized protein IL334_001814 [Kwoniella shivajii]|uniref:TECPR1-like DysF domain-containing protein n=1 Tax=Kwoniella shivajii TaxID=564305 RepID=A0ABZ1CT79_9TREE|nr:hypothetical protein IL334_001814 [Kwoniella shivajii]